MFVLLTEILIKVWTNIVIKPKQHMISGTMIFAYFNIQLNFKNQTHEHRVDALDMRWGFVPSLFYHKYHMLTHQNYNGS